jgi:hypothetical protein
MDEESAYFEEALRSMEKLYGQDVPMSLATEDGDKPNVRVIDVYFRDGAFYATSHLGSNKMKEIAKNPYVALNHQLFVARGRAECIGHPNDPGNAALRAVLMEVFSKFYTRHVNEDDPGTCFLKIEPDWALVFDGGFKYIADFTEKRASRQPFVADILL